MTRPVVDTLLPGFPIGCDQGHIAFCGVFLVQGPDTRGRMTRIVYDVAHVGRRERILEALKQRGLNSKDIDLVVLSHAHWDHIQNVDLFEHAPVLVHRDELRYLQDPHPSDHATPRWTGAVLARTALREVGEGTDVIPGVSVMDLPGHSPGGIGLLVDTERGRALIAGDAVQTAGVAESRRNPIVFWNVALADRSVQRVTEVADIVYPGHDRAFYLLGDGRTQHLEPFSLTLMGFPSDQVGVGFDEGDPETRFVMAGIETQRLPGSA